MATPPKLSSATTNFASLYKYKIAGKSDTLFSTIGSLFGDDAFKLSLFKSKRYNETVAQNNIAADTSLSDSQKQIASADRKTLFLTDATRTLKQNIDKDTNPRKIANAINQIVKELQKSVNDYIAGRGGTTTAVSGGSDGGDTVEISSEAAAAAGGYDAAQDQDFINRVELMTKSLKSLLLKQKGPLRMMGKYFDTNYYQADRRLGEITQAISDFTTGATAQTTGETADPSATAATGDETGTGTDTGATTTPETATTETETPPTQPSLDITV
ncbi:MAG: hypothetical protein H3C49_12535 [Alphaproteobacteria bacterium]|nr:hypothetical protein [Alphaproteobacteria bacterium]